MSLSHAHRHRQYKQQQQTHERHLTLSLTQLAVREHDGRWRWLHSEPIREYTARTAALKATRLMSAEAAGYGPRRMLWVLGTAADALEQWLARANAGQLG